MLLYQFVSTPRNAQFFVRGNDPDGDSGIRGRDDGSILLICFRIQLYADAPQTLTNHSPNPVRMLSDSGRKDQIGKTAQIQEESTDVVDDAGNEHIHGKLRPFISPVRRFQHIAQVVAHAGDAQKTAFFLAPL